MIYRPEIDGLRFIAILLVIGFHAFPNNIKSGFIGVDIFFVISGFLISSLILQNIKDKKFSLINFYQRRIFRIFPALLLLISVILIFGWINLTPHEFQSFAKHGIGSLLFFENYLLASESINYFNDLADKKILLQLWSLAIEEQFYIFFPFLVFIFFRKIKTLILILIFISLISTSVYDFTTPYFSTIPRIWELLAGSLLAAQIEKLNGLISRVKYIIVPKLLAWIFFLLPVTIAIFKTRIENQYFWSAFVAVISTIFLITLIKNGALHQILSSKIMVLGGLISYPLYLWHWSMLSILHIIEGAILPNWLIWSTILLSFILAYLTYRYFECYFKIITLKRFILIILWWICLILSCIYIQSHKGIQWRFEKQNLPIIPVDTYDLKRATDLCAELHPEFERYCSISSNGAPEIIIIGDSHAEDLFLGLEEISKANVMKITGAFCRPYYGNSVQLISGDFCKPLMEKAINFAKDSISVKTVVLSFLKTTEDGRIINSGDIEKTILELIEHNKNVIILLDRPQLLRDGKECVQIRPWKISSNIPDCSIDLNLIQSQWQEFRGIIKNLNISNPQLYIADQMQFFCDISRCFSKINNISLYRDSHHLSIEGSKFVILKMALDPKIKELLKIN